MRYRTWGQSRGRRLPSSVYATVGLPVHVVIGTRHGRNVLREPQVGLLAFDPLASHPSTLAAVVMPSHVHWLLADSAGVSAAVRRYKSFVAMGVRAHGRSGPLWQRSYWDHVIRSTEKLDVVVRYIVENPVEARLCQDWRDDPYTIVFPERIAALR